MSTIEIYLYLNSIFAKNGYSLYMVGGSVRDYLLKIDSYDLDFCSDATPEEMSDFLPDANYRFAKFGTVSLKVDYWKIEITTFRKESNYTDYRHPGTIKFVKTIEEDYLRRDFTINALYIDERKSIIDFCGGVSDLRVKIIRMIGDPQKRIKEDPLRMLRALRFKLKLDFELEETLHQAIIDQAHLLDNLNQQKCEFELKRMFKIDEEAATTLLDQYGIKYEKRN